MLFLPMWDLETIIDALIILAAETGICLLAKASRDRANRVVSLLVCLFLAGLGIFCLFPEQRHATFVSSDTRFGTIVGEALTARFNSEPPSPIWFRGGLTLLLCVPSIFWIWRARRHFVQERDSTQGSQYV
ncbi:MAG TPA: hypothetical protein VK810_02555 [Dongiaceae bacterium]|nr:hypothetical protein [Dongiaceae bacterium]